MSSNKHHHARFRRRNTAVLWLVCLVVIAAATATAALHRLTGWEKTVFFDIYNLPGAWRPAVFGITLLGSGWMFAAITLTFLSFHRYTMAARVIWVSALTYLLVELLKLMVARPRPYALLHSVTPRDSGAHGNGFPSGHAAFSMALAITLWPLIPARWRPMVITAVILIGLSRLYLGVHAPLDIVAGYALGAMVATLPQVRGKFVAKTRGAA